ncbi:GPR endopeptidase [Clostridium sp. MSJ-8]|uniref:GPR endopeptidase n=1 Tax=Clostridium sp. MSJ-8 TaxID=2841510 RepID=UPI001C0F15ED|nr:GPR endopeptidase [Clostridium sp. MSJ-8]MBU5486594.1 GPR endopeptidase [Clostridium sp. MSJ-8]
MENVRTDLACESHNLYVEENNSEPDGIEVEETIQDGTKITIVKVMDKNGEKLLGKPIGTYITLEVPEYTAYDGELMNDVASALGKTLKKLTQIDSNKSVLVVGLGNVKVTPDALGPKVIEKIMVTRHLRDVMPDIITDDVVSVGAMSPGVLGITGIETSEIVSAVVDKIKPDLVICIDALASRKTDRVNRTIQICNSGIAPGAGVGNNRRKLNKETLGVEVISIGVPTVVHASTIASDAIDLVIDDMISKSTKGKEFYKMLKQIDKQEKGILIQELLEPYMTELVVTPKDIDVMIDSMSKIIADGINIAIQPNMTMEEINKFLN